MEKLKAELEKIDSRLGQFAKQLHDNIVSVAALRRLTAKELHEDFHIPVFAAASIAAAYLSSGESLLWQNTFCLSHDLMVERKACQLPEKLHPGGIPSKG